jgi:hypothetical protein
MLESAKTLPAVLRASLTRDQAPEMRDWKQVAVDGDIDMNHLVNKALLRPIEPGGTNATTYICLNWCLENPPTRPPTSTAHLWALRAASFNRHRVGVGRFRGRTLCGS